MPKLTKEDWKAVEDTVKKEIKQKWCIGRWKIYYCNPTVLCNMTMDVESIQDGFVIGMTSGLFYTAIPISSVVAMEKE